MKVRIAVFPGTNCDRDALYALKHNGIKNTDYIWYRKSDLTGVRLLILPGGFSFGDYLRTGAIAIHSELFRAIPAFIRNGGYVVGICNGFQMLTEAKLLPGFLLKNTSKKFISRMVTLRVENNETPFTSCFRKGDLVEMPIAHTTGNYTPLGETVGNNVVFRYCDKNGEVTVKSNPNGSFQNIAGIIDDTGHIMGLMPHFERVSDEFLGTGGIKVIRSIIKNILK